MAMTEDRPGTGGTIDWSQVQRPAFEQLDPSQIEVIYDFDLDELTLHLYGVDMRHTVVSLSDDASALVNRRTNELVGFIIHRFLRHAAVQEPELLAIMSFATVISGNDVVEPHLHGSEPAPGWRGRLHDALNALLGRLPLKQREQALRHLMSIPSLS